eukprot:scaffold6162_cov116-Isochrysis_galbana.AAC.8
MSACTCSSVLVADARAAGRRAGARGGRTDKKGRSKREARGRKGRAGGGWRGVAIDRTRYASG